jgi:hypothetical protein
VLIGVLVGLFILLLIAAGVIAYRLASEHKATNSDRGPGSVSTTTGGPEQTGTPPPSQGGGDQLITIDCAKLRFRQAAAVSQALSSQGFVVTTTDAVGSKQPIGEVVSVSPCKAHRGDTITLSVSPGRGRPSATPTPQQAPSCGIDTPITLCASDLPTGPVVTPGH